jgi:hypothetical protein
MSEHTGERPFNFAKRSAERARAQQQSERKAQPKVSERAEDAQGLAKSINKFYEAKFSNQFETSARGPTVTVTKKAGRSAFTIELLGTDKFKLSGGSGPGGFGADLAVDMSEVSEEEMMDALEDWFNISTA